MIHLTTSKFCKKVVLTQPDTKSDCQMRGRTEGKGFYSQECIIGSEEMALWIRTCCSHEDLNLNPHTPHERPDKVMHSPVTPAMRTGRSLGLVSCQLNSKFRERPGRKVDNDRVGYPKSCSGLCVVMYMHTHALCIHTTHAYIHTFAHKLRWL